MDKIKAGIVGFGRIGECAHLKQMQESDAYEVVGVCDITETRRARAEELGLKTTDNLEELLAWDIDLVAITTHTSAHKAIALQAAAAGKHMMIDKPMALNATDSAEMVDAAKANGVVLTVFHNRHFDPDYRMVKAAVQEGLLGELAFIENRTMAGGPAVGFGVEDYNQKWRITASEGGGTLLDFGPHWTEQVLDLMAGHKVVQIWGDVRHFKWGDVDDHFRIEMVFDNGTRALAQKSDMCYAGLPWKWYILGTEATLRGTIDDAVVINAPESELRRTSAVPAEGLYENLAAHLREGKDLIISAEHALRVMRVLSAAVESSKLGKSVDVDI